MAKFYGSVGFATTEETKPGVHEEIITERKYPGDILRNSRRLQSSGQLNDNVDITMEISIVADPYANHHFHEIRYVERMGVKWKVSNVDATEPPRLKLTLGGLYNG
jgi:hypothetical protein